MKVILVRFILSAHRENNGISTRAAKTKDSGVKNAFYCHLQNEWRQRREGSFIRLGSLMRRSGYTVFLSFKMATASDLLSHNFFLAKRFDTLVGSCHVEQLSWHTGDQERGVIDFTVPPHRSNNVSLLINTVLWLKVNLESSIFIQCFSFFSKRGRGWVCELKAHFALLELSVERCSIFKPGKRW